MVAHKCRAAVLTSLTLFSIALQSGNGLAQGVKPPIENVQNARLIVYSAMARVDALIQQVVESAADRFGLEKPESQVHELAPRWRKGTLVLRPSDPALQSKEIELEVFFHKLVMMRNQLRVLEQKVNSSETLSSAEKFDWQQYITRCYGSMTTFNLLFKEKESAF